MVWLFLSLFGFRRKVGRRIPVEDGYVLISGEDGVFNWFRLLLDRHLALYDRAVSRCSVKGKLLFTVFP